MSSSLFSQFRQNLAVANSGDISLSYAEITKRLNKDFWDSDSETTHCLQVGSYGRHTAIRDVSDIDMVFELPDTVYERLSKVKGNGPSQLLQEVRASLKERYPRTDINGDGQVVVVNFDNYKVEILPAFKQSDGRYRYGDSNDGGSWGNYCNPRAEIDEIDKQNFTSNRNLKHVCKMLRAWKNEHGVAMSGMLIDTLAYNYFRTNDIYNDKSYADYPELMRDVFTFLANQTAQDYWRAPGSQSPVVSKGKFQRKAKKAAAKCQEAIDEEKTTKKVKLWKEIFGRRFPSVDSQFAKKSTDATTRHTSTEQFIEDLFPVDVQYEFDIECLVAHAGKNELRYKFMEGVFSWLRLGRGLTFSIEGVDVPGVYDVYWKVRNVGELAERKNMIRGQILPDSGRRQISEKTEFDGAHYVECYIVKNGICVARSHIDVPIKATQDNR